MACNIVIKNDLRCEIGTYKVNTSEPIANELIRVIRDESIVLNEGDSITIENS